MAVITIKKAELIKSIAENCNSFGSAYMGLYADINGNIAFVHEDDRYAVEHPMAVLTFDCMGNYIDDNKLNAEDITSVAKHIVSDGRYLHFSGFLQMIIDLPLNVILNLFKRNQQRNKKCEDKFCTHA